MFALAVLSALVTAVVAQNPAIDILSIEAQFTNAYIVPDLLESFSPVGVLAVSYSGSAITPGQLLTPDAAQPQPELTLTAANSTVELGSLFTLALVDPGAIGGVNGQQTRHWLVNGVTVGAGGVLSIPASESAITPYGGPFPPDTDSAHRYVFLLYEQPASFAPSGDLATPGQPIAAFDVNGYATSSQLGAVVAASYFTCTRSELVAATSTAPVDTATLSAPASANGSNSVRSSTKTGSSSTSSPTGSGSAGFSNTAPLSVAGFMAVLGFVLA